MSAMEIQSARPLVSVIVAMRNEEGFIKRCLNSLAAQDYPQELLEVLVLDGRSTDQSREIVSSKVDEVQPSVAGQREDRQPGGLQHRHR